jgi:hypothetical protein
MWKVLIRVPTTVLDALDASVLYKSFPSFNIKRGIDFVWKVHILTSSGF